MNFAMTNKVADSSQVSSGNDPPSSEPAPEKNEQPDTPGSKVYKSGPLYLSTRGIGWNVWKKRWFILTRNSLVFFRSDPNAAPQKGGTPKGGTPKGGTPKGETPKGETPKGGTPNEGTPKEGTPKGSELTNLTLGGIDLNSSGSVAVKADKKLLTVHFPDGLGGRSFTFKAETSEDLLEWKAALEEALANAPSAPNAIVQANAIVQDGVLKNDQPDAADSPTKESKDKQTPKALVPSRVIVLALEDVDGKPSYLEKALRFIEEHGVKTEGILRQAADVEEVESRIREFEQDQCKSKVESLIREFEQGKNEFSPDEDPHIISDCIKYILRESPSPLVPTSCCRALLEAHRTDSSKRTAAMRAAIRETFTEQNRRLLKRILAMMRAVVSHKDKNRMNATAVAACMAPLLLRPILAGECERENDSDMGGDDPALLLLKAAAAANHAQAIVVTLIEEYNTLFVLS